MTSANVQVSIAGGAVVTGPVTVPFGSSVQLSAANTSGWTSALWQMVDYPPGMACPAGWSTDAMGNYYFQPANPTTLPPAFNAPAAGANNWGKIPVRLTVNNNPARLLANGAANPAYNPALTDTSLVMSIRSPNLAMEGLGATEANQWDVLRNWAGGVMRMFRLVDAGSSGGGGGSMQYVNAATVFTVAQAGTIFLVDTSAGGFTVTLPNAASLAAASNGGNGLWWEVVDVPLATSGGHPLGKSGWQSNPLLVSGNGIAVVDPNYVGSTGATNSPVTLTTARGRFRFTYSVAAGLYLC